MIGIDGVDYQVSCMLRKTDDRELYGFAKVVGLDKVIELVRNGGVK